MWDLSSRLGDRTHAPPALEGRVITAVPLGESQAVFLRGGRCVKNRSQISSFGRVMRGMKRPFPAHPGALRNWKGHIPSGEASFLIWPVGWPCVLHWPPFRAWEQDDQAQGPVRVLWLEGRVRPRPQTGSPTVLPFGPWGHSLVPARVVFQPELPAGLIAKPSSLHNHTSPEVTEVRSVQHVSYPRTCNRTDSALPPLRSTVPPAFPGPTSRVPKPAFSAQAFYCRAGVSRLRQVSVNHCESKPPLPTMSIPSPCSPGWGKSFSYWEDIKGAEPLNRAQPSRGSGSGEMKAPSLSQDARMQVMGSEGVCCGTHWGRRLAGTWGSIRVRSSLPVSQGSEAGGLRDIIGCHPASQCSGEPLQVHASNDHIHC